MAPEEELVKKSLNGDIQAFEELVLKYQEKIFALAYRYMGNEEDAYDMSQEAFIKAYQSLHSFQGGSSFGTWLYQIASNICRDELRRQKRKKISVFSLDEAVVTQDNGQVKREIADISLTADILYEQKEFSLYLQEILDQMKTEHKSAIILRDLMGLSYEEIAEVMNCSIGTVKSRISRARSILKKKLLKKELSP